MVKKPTIFEFVSYKFEPEQKRISFNYRQIFDVGDPLDFTEILHLPEIPNTSSLPDGLLDKILEGVHLILGISYYKFYCAEKLKIPYSLSKKEADFWNIVYKKGLGEFFFRNSLNPNISPKFPYSFNAKPVSFALSKNNKCLVAVSGGKDSIVAAELLKEQKVDITAIFTETQRESKIVNDVMAILGVNYLRFRRILDEKINQKHKYDGHVPVSAMFAFLGILYAILYKHSYCIMANEYSSNFGNTYYKGQNINHQWSKSSEFETMFSDYVYNFISPDVKYFSLLRPFYEIRIAKQFSNYKKYFSHFSSCNKNFTVNEAKKTNSLWCGQCPKCVFAFTLLSAFLPKKDLLGIFKKDLYQDENLFSLFKDILGFGKIKPFDCVGTFDESRTAFLAGSKNFKSDFIVKKLAGKIRISKKLEKDLFIAHKSPNIPEQFKFLGMNNVLILGYGKEGEVSKKYLKKNFPKIKIEISDEKTEKKYLTKQYDFDLVVKTPGIKKSLVNVHYTTATNIFFSKIKEMGNLTIGVTGSKGKSTTTALIGEILKEAGKDVKVLGNIGEPMLGSLLKLVEKGQIFVLELSSYQLDDIAFSPNISVVTNLFPEHMDYHYGLANYYRAKKNIIKFQGERDIFIYNPKNKQAKKWSKEARSTTKPFINAGFLLGVKTNLVGDHNKENILAAATVAKELGISDEIIKSAIEKFKPLPHRLQLVGEFLGIKFYDDSISTTPESTIMAIKSLQNVETIFLGGQDRGYDFAQLEKNIKKYKIRNIALFPDSGKKIKVRAENVLRTKSMEEAVRFAYKHTSYGKICLLSCASPSYSLWKNFEEKGDQFQKFVRKFSKEPRYKKTNIDEKSF